MRAGRRSARLALLATVALVGPGCQSTIDIPTTETWAADLTTSGRVLFMTFGRDQTSLTGTGSLAFLTGPGAEQLTLSGTRRADTLAIVFRRPSGSEFSFTGWYVVNHGAISGVLNGSDFVNLSVAFRRN